MNNIKIAVVGLGTVGSNVVKSIESLNKSNKVNQSKKNKLDEQTKSIQITSTLTIIHLLFLVSFAIVIRGLIIEKIEGFYKFIGVQYATFQGKTVGNSGD